jgi:peptidoglycan/xylan/chitin deacetylase (PgdA/CDA1 family)
MSSRFRSRNRHMRIDRFVTIGIHRIQKISSIIRKLGRRSKGDNRGLPILMYHSISEDPENGISPYFRTVTTPSRFLEQMRFLKLRGWRGVSLRDGMRLRDEQTGAVSAERLFALTFDDGFRDFLTSAVPILDQCGFGATMFLPTAFIANSSPPSHFLSRPCLNWREVQELHSGGIEFGSHTVNHPMLIDLGWTQIQAELADSKAMIEARIQYPISAFSYPFAYPQADRAFCTQLRQTLALQGYKTCVTTTIGSSSDYKDPYCLRRLPVNNDDDPALLIAKIEGAYNWLSGPQHAYKTIKRISHGLKHRRN